MDKKRQKAYKDSQDHRKKERHKRDQGKKDSTRISKLNERQLSVLWQQVDEGTVTRMNLPLQYWCVESNRRAESSRLYPLGVCLNLYGMDQPGDYSDCLSYYKFPLTHVVLATEGKFASATDDEASHLCDNTWCIRVGHLVWESRELNARRKGCPGGILVNNELHSACVHFPPCIKICEQKLSRLPE